MNLSSALVPLALNAITGVTWGHRLAGVRGGGTLADPWRGVLYALSQEYAPDRVFAVSGVVELTTDSEFGFHADGYTGMKLIGYGATILYTGSSTINTMGSFSGNELVAGNFGCDITGFKFDGNSKVAGNMVLVQAMHSVLLDLTCVRGTGTAVKIRGCTSPFVRRLRCAGSDHSGNVNPFQTGLDVDEVVSTSNDTTVAVFRGLEISRTQSDCVLIDNALAVEVQGGFSASVAGWGLVAGSRGPVESLKIFAGDTETSGPIIVTTGGHQGIRIASQCQQTLIDTCENLDASLQIDAGAGTVTAINSHFYGAIHNSSSPFIQIGCLGMNPDQGQIFGTGTGPRLFLNNTTTGTLFMPDTTIGQGTNGTRFGYAQFGGPLLVNAADWGSLATRYMLYNSGGASGGTALNGAVGSDIRVGGNNVIQATATRVDLSQPLVMMSYTVSGLPAAGTKGRQAFASNGRNSGEGAGVGTGCPVYDNGVAWFAVWSGLAVTV